MSQIIVAADRTRSNVLVLPIIVAAAQPYKNGVKTRAQERNVDFKENDYNSLLFNKHSCTNGQLIVIIVNFSLKLINLKLKPCNNK